MKLKDISVEDCQGLLESSVVDKRVAQDLETA